MKEQIGLNFAAALRSFLRQDPNIILVGEIRDFETAEVAIKAAMTGHLVLSTLHTNDAPSSINRLMNMGIEPFLVATSVHMIVAQRLVRRICTFCKEPVGAAAARRWSSVGFSEHEARTIKLFRGRGCERCSNTGYKGRVGLYEVMEIDDEMREMILSGASAFELRQKAIQSGMITLRGSGLQKIRDGDHHDRRGRARDGAVSNALAGPVHVSPTAPSASSAFIGLQRATPSTPRRPGRSGKPGSTSTATRRPGWAS